MRSLRLLDKLFTYLWGPNEYNPHTLDQQECDETEVAIYAPHCVTNILQS